MGIGEGSLSVGHRSSPDPGNRAAGSKFISAAAVRNFATWQGGSGGDCLLATPAGNTTWGGLKALYR